MAGDHWGGFGGASGLYCGFLPYYSGKRSPFWTRTGCLKIMREKLYSSRKEWYYGIKLHAVVVRISGRRPIPVSLMASGTARHGHPDAKQIVDGHASLKSGRLYADKAYIDAGWAQSLRQNHALELLTPQKSKKVMSLLLVTHSLLLSARSVSRLSAFSQTLE